MSYEFYLDVYVIETFVMNYVLLRMTNKLLRCSATHLRSLLCAVISAVLSAVSLIGIYRYGITCTLLVSVAVNTFMVKFGCKIKEGRRLVQGMLLFYMGTACMGLAFSLLRRITGQRGIHAFLVISAVSYLFLNICIWVYEKGKVWQQRYCRVTLYHGERCKSVKGLCDTGNMLWDTTLQSYVSVIGIPLMKELFSEEVVRELESFCGKRIPKSPELLSAMQPHYIPYRCVGCEEGLLPAVVLDKMCLEQGEIQKVIIHPVIAVDKTYSSSLRSYQMILNPNLIDN